MKGFGTKFLRITGCSPLARDGWATLSVPYRIVTSAVSSTLHVLVSCCLGGSLWFAANLPNPDDGLCAIDIDHMKKVVLDTATNHEISAAAKSILDRCVLRDESKKHGNTPIGGYLNYIGQ